LNVSNKTEKRSFFKKQLANFLPKTRPVSLLINSLKMRLFFILFTFLCLSTGLSGQSEPDSYCGTPNEPNSWLDYYFAHKDQLQTENDQIVVGMRLSILGNDNGTGYFRPVSILDALCRLNQDFEEANIRFYLSEDFNYIPNTYWNTHEDFDAGADLIQSNPVWGAVNAFISTGAAGNCGYYWMNAVALAKSCTGPADHTFAHEMGHYFSLPHTFSGWEGIDYDPAVPTANFQNDVFRPIENVTDTDCNDKADRFCDTPPDYLSYRWTCDQDNNSTVEQTDLNGETFVSDGSLFMSYALDNCAGRFSPEQIDAMRANIMFDRPEIIVNAPVVPVDDSDMQLLYPAPDDLVPNNGLTLRWAAVPGATQYILEVTRYPFTGIKYFNQFVKDTFITINDLPAGKTLSYRIRPFNESWFCTQWSERTIFETFLVSGTSDTEIFDRFEVFPTMPVDGQPLTILLNSPFNFPQTSVTISTPSGYEVFRQKVFVTAGENQFQIAPGTLPSGLYLLNVSCEAGRLFRKIIVP